jgi:hypothetical protein
MLYTGDNPERPRYDRNMANWSCLKSSNEIFASFPWGSIELEQAVGCSLDNMFNPQQNICTLCMSKDTGRGISVLVALRKSGRSSARKLRDLLNILDISIRFWEESILWHGASESLLTFVGISIAAVLAACSSICAPQNRPGMRNHLGLRKLRPNQKISLFEICGLRIENFSQCKEWSRFGKNHRSVHVAIQ